LNKVYFWISPADVPGKLNRRPPASGLPAVSRLWRSVHIGRFWHKTARVSAGFVGLLAESRKQSRYMQSVEQLSFTHWARGCAVATPPGYCETHICWQA
jgi:hypothetical protein